MTIRTRVNVTTRVNTKAIRDEMVDGEAYKVIPCATMPDDVVMNGVLYPADEIAKSYATLENTFAPLGHPDRDGSFLNASDPVAIDRFGVGAHNRNVRRENGRVFMEKYLHVATAQSSERGKRVLDAIAKGGPIHTSTGLYAIMEAANGEVPYSRIARDIVFDHDAILLDEEGAATPEQGVGMLVNSKGEKEQIPVINSTFSEDADRELDWAITSVAQALQRKDQVSMLEKWKAAILGLITGAERETPTNSKEADMSEVKKEDFDKLSGEVKTLSDSLAKIGDTVTAAVNGALKPLQDQLDAATNAQKAKDEAELTTLRKAIVEGNLMDEATAGELTLNAARKLAPMAKPGHSFALNGAFSGGKKDDGGGAYQLPADEE